MKERNYGIDLLRVISMIGVMALHVLGHGGVLANTKILTLNYNIAWLQNILFCSDVNCFVLITGYFGGGSKNISRYTNLIVLWLQTFFYSVVIMLLFVIFGGAWNIKENIKALLPLVTTQYWFFSMYFGMMLFAPIMNEFVNRTELKKVIVILLSLVSTFTILSIVDGNVFELKGGYSVLWFIVLYMCGATLNKIQSVYEFDLCKVKRLTYGMLFGTWISKLLLDYISLRLTGGARFGNILLGYTSPTIFIVSCGLLIIFSNIKCNKLIPFLKVVAPLTFSAYLIQDNVYVRKYFITDKFAFLADKNVFILIIGIISSAILCFAVGCLIDSIRNFLFRKFKIKYRIYNVLNMMFNK